MAGDRRGGSGAGVLLGAVGAGAAAWAAGAPARHRLNEQLAAARVHPAAAEAHRLGATVVILVVPYLLGHGVAFTLTARTFPPGLDLWLGYLVLGLFTVLLAAAWGWVLGKLLGSVFAALTATLSSLVLVILLEDYADLGLMVVRAPPEMAVDPIVMVVRLGAVIALLATLPWLSDLDRLRAHAPAALLPAAMTLALAGTLAATTAVVQRDLPGENVTCVDGPVLLCVWPEQQKYVPLLRDLNARVDALPEVFTTPPRMNEIGIERTRYVDNQGVIRRTDGEHAPTFSIVEGSPWSYAGQIATAIMSATWRGCAWETITDADRTRLPTLDAWLEAYLVGGGQPDYSTDAPAQMRQAWATGRAIANERPLVEQLDWAGQEAQDIHERYCQPRA